jgi:hypothetical protein
MTLGVALTRLLFEKEISPEQYGQYLSAFPSTFGFHTENMLWKYSMPKKKDREMKMPDFLTT